MNKTNPSASNSTTASTTARRESAPASNIEQLAAKVYQLMQEDARLARARGDAQRARK